MTDDEAIRLSNQAAQALELTDRAFSGLKEAITTELVETTFEQQEKRERLYVALKTLAMVRGALTDAVAAGDVARTQLEYRQVLATNGLTRP
jgi:hypothetical protein